MDREQFWALIEAAKAATGGDCRAQTAQLVAALGQGLVEAILDWDRIHSELRVESYRWDLWGAASLINGGCGDDGFDYFRGWLLGQGRAVWQAALADPDSLADHPGSALIGPTWSSTSTLSVRTSWVSPTRPTRP
jgi:hypothetical protein